jgi:hypothetical protein
MYIAEGQEMKCVWIKYRGNSEIKKIINEFRKSEGWRNKEAQIKAKASLGLLVADKCLPIQILL